jgi:hypothetical protein
MKNKKFDCVITMRDIRKEIQQETKDLTEEEIIEKLKKEFPELHKERVNV